MIVRNRDHDLRSQDLILERSIVYARFDFHSDIEIKSPEAYRSAVRQLRKDIANSFDFNQMILVSDPKRDFDREGLSIKAYMYVMVPEKNKPLEWF